MNDALNDASPEPAALYIILKGQRPASAPRSEPARRDAAVFAYSQHLNRVNGIALRPDDDPPSLLHATRVMMGRVARAHARGRMTYLGLLQHPDEPRVFSALLCLGYEALAQSVGISPALFAREERPAITARLSEIVNH